MAAARGLARGSAELVEDVSKSRRDRLREVPEERGASDVGAAGLADDMVIRCYSMVPLLPLTIQWRHRPGVHTIPCHLP